MLHDWPTCAPAFPRCRIYCAPKRSATRHANSMKIDMVKLSDPWAVRRLQIVVRELDSRPAFIRQLVELLVNERDVVGNH